MPMKTPNVPPVCNMTLARFDSSSLPRKPYLIPATVPNIAPTDTPTAPPIITPYLILSKQETPPRLLPATGMALSCSYPEIKATDGSENSSVLQKEQYYPRGQKNEL